MQKTDYKDISTEDIKKALEEMCGDSFIKNFRWTDEKGQVSSTWHLGDGLWTGNAGAKLFMQTFKDKLNGKEDI